MFKEKILGAVARGWCSPKNEHKVMDIDLAESITKEVVVVLDKLQAELSKANDADWKFREIAKLKA